MCRILERNLLCLAVVVILCFAFSGPQSAFAAPGIPTGLEHQDFAGDGEYWLWRDCTFDWMDISTTGTNLGLDDDDDSGNLLDDASLTDFTFLFFNQQISFINVTSNGLIHFSSSTSTSRNNGASVPDIDNGGNGNDDACIMPVYRDLLPGNGSFNVFWEVVSGTELAHDRVLVIQYNKVPVYDNRGVAHCQVVLEETTATIKFQYMAMSHRGSNINTDEGGWLTLGIQLDGSTGMDMGSGEKVLGTETAFIFDPRDTDNDDVPDSVEEQFGWNPAVANTHNTDDDDDDTVSNLDELEDGTDPLSDDTDLDGLDDGEEKLAGCDPLCADSDCDGLLDGSEDEAGTDALDPDTDGDLLLDGFEVLQDLDPLVANNEADWNGLFSNLDTSNLLFDFYVDAVNGDDLNDGASPSTAFATIGAAVTAANAPDMNIYIAAGVYSESTIQSDETGTQFFGASQCLVILDCDGSNGFYVNEDDQTIRNITIREGDDFGVWAWSCDGLQVDNCRIIASNAANDFEDGDDSADGKHGFRTETCGTSSSPVVISNCLFEDLNLGINVKDDSSVQVIGCSFVSVIKDVFNVKDLDTNGRGLVVQECTTFASSGSKGIVRVDSCSLGFITFTCNQFYYSSGHGMLLSFNSATTTIENNLFFGCRSRGINIQDSDNVSILNNTITCGGNDGIKITDSSDSIELFNNDITWNDGNAITNDSSNTAGSDYNNSFQNGGDYSGTFNDGDNVNGIAVNPLYRDFETGDLFYLAASPLFGAGDNDDLIADTLDDNIGSDCAGTSEAQAFMVDAVAGGCFEINDPADPLFGFSIDFPAGALDQNTEVIVTIFAGGLTTAPNQVGDVIDIDLGDATLTGDVEICLLAPNREAANRIYHYNDATGEWEKLSNLSTEESFGQTLVCGDTNSLSPFALGKASSSTPFVENDDNDNDIINCFIATASLADGHGTNVNDSVASHYLSNERLADLNTLRSFRNAYLMNNVAGRAFVNCYYTYGPYAAATIVNRPAPKFVVRTTIIAPLVSASKVMMWKSLNSRDITGFFMLLLYFVLFAFVARKVYKKIRARIKLNIAV